MITAEPIHRIQRLELRVCEPQRPYGPTSTDIATAWIVEVRRRVAAFERGELKAHAAQNVFAEARRLAE